MITSTATIDYQALFVSAPSLFLILKPDAPVFTILDANDAYLAATLTKREEIVGNGLFVVFPDNPEEIAADGVHNLHHSLDRVLQRKQTDIMPTQKYDVLIPGSDDQFEEKYWNPRNTPVLDEHGEVVYIIHQVEDVTGTVLLMRKMEENTAQANAELEKKTKYIQENEERINLILEALLKFTQMDFSQRLVVSDRGDELDAIAAGLNALIDELESFTKLLNETNVELEYANKELDSFSYSVSHDLRAPLRAINGYSQLLMEDYADKIDADGRNTIEVIIRNASRMGELIDNLLTFSRIGKQQLVKVDLNMNAIASSVIQDFADGPTKFIVHPLASVKGDNSMITQVMTNLISNAVKYSGKKENPTVEIGCTTDKDQIVYYVKDNGAGFDMRYYDKLFGVFQRLHSAKHFEGTGVGLALVQRILKKHNGEVWAESVPDEGATFYFSLPS